MELIKCRGAEVDSGVFAGCHTLNGIECPVCSGSGNEKCAICGETIDASEKDIHTFLYWRWHLHCITRPEAGVLVAKIRTAVKYMRIIRAVTK